MVYKKLSEATLVQDAMDTANVLIEENDEIKRVPKHVMGKVKTVNGIEPDENGNVSVGEVKTVNGIEPDENGNIEIGTDTVLYLSYDEYDNDEYCYIYWDAACTEKVTKSELEEIDIKCIKMESSEGYILNCKLLYHNCTVSNYDEICIWTPNGPMSAYTAEYYVTNEPE